MPRSGPQQIGRSMSERSIRHAAQIVRLDRVLLVHGPIILGLSRPRFSALSRRRERWLTINGKRPAAVPARVVRRIRVRMKSCPPGRRGGGVAAACFRSHLRHQPEPHQAEVARSAENATRSLCLLDEPSTDPNSSRSSGRACAVRGALGHAASTDQAVGGQKAHGEWSDLRDQPAPVRSMVSKIACATCKILAAAW